MVLRQAVFGDARLERALATSLLQRAEAVMAGLERGADAPTPP